MNPRSRVTRRRWILYLQRPYDLLGASLWVCWYASDVLRRTAGVAMERAFCRELASGGVAQYRIPSELHRFGRALERLAAKRSTVRHALTRAFQLNRQAERVLRVRRTTGTLEEHVAALTELAVFGTILPFFLGRYVSRSWKFERRALEGLRMRSFYQPYYLRLVQPAAKRRAVSLGLRSPAVHVLTVAELLRGDTQPAARRLHQRSTGKRFLYWFDRGREQVRMVRPASAPSTPSTVREIRGITAYPGVRRGRVRIVHDVRRASRLRRGEILVAPSTNPNLVPYMRRAGAIVTDEGGITSHAAIISRELKKPCVIGTKYATEVLKDGDLVEVDAGRGVVRRLRFS